MPNTRFTQKSTTLKTDDLTITFGPKVLDGLSQLHLILQDRPGFDSETLALINDMAAPRPHSIPIAFAALTRIFAESAQYSGSRNIPAATAILADIRDNLSGMGEERNPIRIATLAAKRTR